MFYNKSMEIDRTVLCYINRGDEYLFMKRNKKKNDLNHDKWIGVGGHIEKGESKEAALKREVEEETGLVLKDFDYRGDILFINDDYEENMYLFTSDKYEGNVIDCDEGELHWIHKSEIMNLNLWEGDRTFLPLLINTKKFIKMKLVYKQDKLIDIIDESEMQL